MTMKSLREEGGGGGGAEEFSEKRGRVKVISLQSRAVGGEYELLAVSHQR